jgi:hypothetical protein
MSGWGKDGRDGENAGEDGDGSDPWFHPVWADEAASGAAVLERLPAPSAQVGADPWLANPVLGVLLGPLCATTDALARLDARAAAASNAVREGLAARLALREAAGWLAHRVRWVHPHDLALRGLGLTGHYGLALSAGRGRHELPNTLGAATAWADLGPAELLGADDAVVAALHLARHHRQLAFVPTSDPLADTDAARAALEPLGRGQLDGDRLAAWLIELPRSRGGVQGRQGRGASGRGQGGGAAAALPPLLAAARAAQRWMEAGVADLPDPAQAGLVAAAWLARAGVLRASALPLWTAYPAVGRGEADALPGLRERRAAPLGDLAAAPVIAWPLSFLVLAREGALAGLRELDRLLAAAERGRAVLARRDRRSRLPDALDQALRAPVLTGTALATRLRVAPQTATALLRDLAGLGLVQECTGRDHFRAWAA